MTELKPCPDCGAIMEEYEEFWSDFEYTLSCPKCKIKIIGSDEMSMDVAKERAYYAYSDWID